MNKIAKFEKVSWGQFKKDCEENNIRLSDTELKSFYDNIKLPTRATKGSAGYDFYNPIPFTLYPAKSIVIPTGVRAKIEDNWFLSLYPRSGLGFKYGVRLSNTVGIIDSDYYYAHNEGHILIKLRLPSAIPHISTSIMTTNAGDRICQGVFQQYGITIDDDIDARRYGGFGSTDV